jgi:hypothetical protein
MLKKAEQKVKTVFSIRMTGLDGEQQVPIQSEFSVSVSGNWVSVSCAIVRDSENLQSEEGTT